MSYDEYYDLIKRVNNKKTKYVIYCLDGVGEDRKDKHEEFVEDSFVLMKKMTEIFLNIDKEIMVDDRYICVDEDCVYKDKLFLYRNNPNFTNGDFISFYFYNDKMTPELFKKVFKEAYKYTSKNFRYHLSKCNYETNNYSKGNKLLYVGYAKAYLEHDKSTRIEKLGSRKINKR